MSTAHISHSPLIKACRSITVVYHESQELCIMSHNGGYQTTMGGSLASFVNQTLQLLEAKEKDIMSLEMSMKSSHLNDICL